MKKFQDENTLFFSSSCFTTPTQYALSALLKEQQWFWYVWRTYLWKYDFCLPPTDFMVQPGDFLSLQTIHWSGEGNCLNRNK